MCQEERTGVFSASGLAHGGLEWPSTAQQPDRGIRVPCGSRKDLWFLGGLPRARKGLSLQRLAGYQNQVRVSEACGKQKKEVESLDTGSGPVKQQKQLGPNCLNLYSRNSLWIEPKQRGGARVKRPQLWEGRAVEAENSRPGLDVPTTLTSTLLK